MKQYLFFFTPLFFLSQVVNAQSPGDTIITSTFNYSQTQSSRDTMIQFPNLPGVTYEKIYMLYNMRCKNGLVSPAISGQTNIGCGEWDYICNTYIMDSTKTDSVKAQHPSHIITGFSGTTYNYTTQPTYTYYQYNQQNVTNSSTISETTSTVGTGSSTNSAPLNTALQTSKSQFLWTASELSTAGVTAGNITSLKLNINSLGSDAQFLKIKMKHTTQSVLNASNPDLNGFTEVYFLNTPVVNGVNQFHFYNPFVWNGVDNILIEFSFSNPTNGTNNIIASDITPNVMGLVSEANDYSFEFTGSNHQVLGNANFSGFSNQISIAFWSYGNANNLPTNTSILYAANTQNHRQANVHLPWSNSSVYWDCGSGGSYDRIDKPATPNNFEGQWNHWTFTKNSTTGIMNIYLNGTLWHTGTGKTLPVEITDLFLGKSNNLQNAYFGKIDDLSIWKKELSAPTIQAWMYKALSASHPDYADLIAYYNFNEGSGIIANDSSPAAAVSNIFGTELWRLHKGENIFKNYTEINTRPTISFVQGVYTQTITPIVILDSIINISNTVNTYVVQLGNIVQTATNIYYQAGYSYVYDAVTNALIDSVLNNTMNTINITNLDYFRKSPSAFQMVSFVTPYGINLDLGMTGKTWVFDVTDFAPILKGWKRMFINGGGERQEDMDIKFMFIVGTPPRDVIDINNIWKVDAVGYTNILNDNMFEPRNVTMNNSAVSYKIKTAITGHGQDGEFIPRTHSINIGGGSSEFNWDVWKECAENPVYPQGGTWIYDRAGWCPGMATDVKEMDITSYVSPGNISSIDYGINTASGQSDYVVSNQLVSYGGANFTLDASVVDIKNPSKKIEHARTNAICDNPLVVIKNTGSTALTSLTIEYWVNNNSVHETYNWTGNLAFLESAEVSLPVSDNLWGAVNGALDNVFRVEIKNPNNGTDGYVHNNKMNSQFDITNVVPSNFYIWFKTNNAASESKYEIIDGNGVQVFVRNNMANNTQYKDTLQLGWGCYSFIVSDTDDDGIDFWANSDGVGYARFRTLSGGVVKNFEGDFGKSLIYNFTIDFPLSYEDLQLDKENIILFPNPAKNEFVLKGENLVAEKIIITNQIGQSIKLPYFVYNSNEVHFNSSSLPKGIYFVKTFIGNKEVVKMLSIE